MQPIKLEFMSSRIKYHRKIVIQIDTLTKCTQDTTINCIVPQENSGTNRTR